MYPKAESRNPIITPRKDSHSNVIHSDKVNSQTSDSEESKMNRNIPQSSLPPDGGVQVMNTKFIMDLFNKLFFLIL